MATRKTALMIDDELVHQARQILGTKTTTETLHEALMEVIRVHARARHFERLRRREGFDPDVMIDGPPDGARRKETSAWGAGVGDAPR